MAEKESIAGNYHVLFDNENRGPVWRMGYHVWKHETKDFYIHVGYHLTWGVSTKSQFDKETGRTREILLETEIKTHIADQF